MKTLRKVVMGAAVLVLLTGCSSMKKVDYETFHEKAVEAVKGIPDAGFTKVAVKGNVTTGGQEIKLDGTYTVENGVVTSKPESTTDMIAISYLSITADLVPNEEIASYYAGGGFKYTAKEDGNSGEVVFNKYGLITSVKSSDSDGNKMSVTAKWSK